MLKELQAEAVLKTAETASSLQFFFIEPSTLNIVRNFVEIFLAKTAQGQ